LIGRQKGRKAEEENAISYRMAIRKIEDAIIYKRKHSLESSLWKRFWASRKRGKATKRMSLHGQVLCLLLEWLIKIKQIMFYF
jgi:hypothetical protein